MKGKSCAYFMGFIEASINLCMYSSYMWVEASQITCNYEYLYNFALALKKKSTKQKYARIKDGDFCSLFLSVI